MKKILVLCLFLAGLSACSCPAARRAVEEVDKSHEIVSKQLLKYVEKDAALSQKDKDDWKALVDSDRRNIEKLKKAMEE